MTYRRDIDGLRAIAILLVVIFHFQIVAFGKSGFIGVDIFFVISGFLITKIILGDLETGRFSLKTFYLKRFRRLYPALLTTMGLYLAVAYFVFLPDTFLELGKEVLLSLGYVVNFYYWQTVNYFGLQATKVPLLHTWSLAIEEQFYLLFPLVMMLVFRFWRKALLPLLGVATIGSFALGVFAAGWKPEAAFYLLPTRAWELLMGSVLAVALTEGRRVPQGLATVLGLLGLGAILAALVVHSPLTKTPGWFTLLPTLAAMALILAGTSERAPTTRALGLAPMVWIGKISYPLYLVHWPILILQNDMLETYGYAHRVLGLLASVLLAWGIYRFVETPIRHGLPTLRPARILGVLGGATVALAAVAAVIVLTKGAPGRFSPEAMAAYAVRADSPQDVRICDFAAREAAPCRLGDKDADPQVLLIGDSHAAHLAPALDLWLNETDGAGRLVFGHACLPVPGVGPKRCAGYAEDVVAWAETSESIRVVMLESIWLQATGEGMVVGGVWTTGDAVQAGFAAALDAMVTRLQAAGKTVVLIDPFFVTPNPVPETLAKNMIFGRNWSVEKPLEDHRATFAPIHAAFERAEMVGAKRISLIEDFCEGGICQPFHDGTPILVDTNHLTASIAPVIAQKLGRELVRVGVKP